MPKPTLLFLSHRLPFPPHNGAAIRTFNVLRLLARFYDITALCFDRLEPATSKVPLQRRIDGLSDFGRFSVFNIPQQSSRVRFIADHLRSVVTHQPYTYFTHDSAAFHAALRQAMRDTKFDLIHVDSLDLVRLVRDLPLDRVILTHHNTESALLARRAAAETAWSKRAYLSYQAGLLRDAERTWLPRVAMNVAVSEDDKNSLRQIAPEARFGVVPNGVDVDFFRPVCADQRGIVFVGGTSYFPNLDGLKWFASSVLPEIRARGCREEVVFVGRARSDEIAHFNTFDGLKLTGYVEDIRPYVNAAACFIVPLRVGGGTRLKLVDAWAMGKAVVSTTIGAEGLDAKENENILLCDTPAAFADGVIEVVRNIELRRRLESGARRTAESIYSWEVVAADMLELYESVRRSAAA